MAEGTSQPPDATRYIETSRGVLSYQQLAPLLAERVLKVQEAIEQEVYAGRALDEGLIQDFHRAICGDLVSAWAGCWRSIPITVGTHQPPPPHEVPLRMRDYALDLQARWVTVAEPATELFLETLAFAEGRLLSIHPFRDFNGRVARLFLAELLRRAGLPLVDLAPATEAERRDYIAALRDGDGQDWRALVEVWRKRFEKGETETS